MPKVALERLEDALARCAVRAARTEPDLGTLTNEGLSSSPSYHSSYHNSREKKEKGYGYGGGAEFCILEEWLNCGFRRFRRQGRSRA